MEETRPADVQPGGDWIVELLFSFFFIFVYCLAYNKKLMNCDYQMRIKEFRQDWNNRRQRRKRLWRVSRCKFFFNIVINFTFSDRIRRIKHKTNIHLENLQRDSRSGAQFDGRRPSSWRECGPYPGWTQQREKSEKEDEGKGKGGGKDETEVRILNKFLFCVLFMFVL